MHLLSERVLPPSVKKWGANRCKFARPGEGKGYVNVGQTDAAQWTESPENAMKIRYSQTVPYFFLNKWSREFWGV